MHVVFRIMAIAALIALPQPLSAQPIEDDSSSTAPAAPTHEIVFAGHTDAARKDYDIWRIAPDGSQLASLVTLPGHQTSFAISRDGKDIFYSSLGPEGASDIWRRRFDRGEPVNLTNHPSSDFGPCLSPDGARMAFFSNRDEAKPELYVMSLDTGDVNRLTENKYHESGACWSPNGAHILFTRFLPRDDGENKSGDGEIIQLDVESGDEQQLTELGGFNGGLDISPDGARVAFHRTGDKSVEVWVMDADGKNAAAITKSTLDEYSPAWSPDGNWLAYTAGRGSDARGRYDLWLMRPDGSDQRIISKAANTQMEPAWRPGELHAY